MSLYFGQSQTSGAEADSNEIYGNTPSSSGANDISFSAKVTTGKDNLLFIDICGAYDASSVWGSAAGSKSLRVRVDIARLNPATGHDNVQTITTPCIYLKDVSLVEGNLSQYPDNYGARLPTAENIPMLFRTLCGDNISSNNRAIRVTLKHPHVYNGDKVSVYLQKLAPTDQFKITDASIAFDTVSTTARRPLVNGGPLGGDNAIVPYEAVISRTPGTTDKGDIKIYTDAPLFEEGGAGIDISAVTFMIRKVGTNTEEFEPVSRPAYPPARNAAGKYEYFIRTMTDVDGNAYQIQAQGVFDEFNVFAVANQPNIGGQPLILDNKPQAVLVSGIKVDGSHPGLGGKAVVEFGQATAAEGYRTIQRYTAYYVSKAQADALSSVNSKGVDVKTAQVNVKNIKAAHPNQVAYLENADISKQDPSVKQHLTINLANSSLVYNGTVDKNTSYAVLLTASTKNSAGEFVEGDGPADMSSSSWAATPAYGTDASMGFVVSGAPAVPSPIRVSVGKDVSSGNLNNLRGDLSMNNAVRVTFNDFNVNMRGDKYTKVAYAIIRAQDLPYIANNFVKDGSYTEFDLAYDGNDTIAESMYIKATDTSGIKYIVNDEGEWAAAGTGNKDMSNGSLGYIQYVLKNQNGVGSLTAWLPFTPSTHPAALEAASTPNLFLPDPSGDGLDARFGQPGAASPTGTLLQSVITSDELAAAVGLDTSNKKIKVGFSLKNKTETAKGAAGKVDIKLSGGAAITGMRYVIKSATDINDETSNMRAVRLYGDATKDICSSTGPVRVSNALDKLEVTQVYDASGFYSSLKFGKRYDISFVPVNANGYNDASALHVKGFASMGTLGAIQNVRKGSEVVRMMTGADKCEFDLSMSDICGVAQHGGHLVTAYNVKVEQNVNGLYRTLRDFGKNAAGSDGRAVDVSTTGLVAKATRRLQLTNVGGTGATACLAGYPLRVTIRAEANAATSTNGNVAEVVNLYYNKNRAKVLGAETVITLPGPVMQGDATDEVRGLNVVDGDEKLTVTFNKPEADTVNGVVGEPILDGYQIYLYDMSLTTIPGTSANTNKALARIVHIVSSADVNVTDPFVKEFTNLPNGKAYVVAVHTNWKYGENNNSRFTTYGKYHTFANATSSQEATEFATQDANGLWVLPTSGIKSGGASSLKVADCAVPRGTPIISYTLEPASLRFDTNGAPILFGAMIQMAPEGNSNSNAEAFYLDMCGADAKTGSKNTTAKVGLHEVNRLITDICATTILGENWATEKNFVMVQNEAGSSYVKINIV